MHDVHFYFFLFVLKLIKRVIKMKILSLNLHCFKEENRIEKLDKIADFIVENDIDVCIFQEVAQLQEELIIKDTIKNGNNAYHIAEKTKYFVAFHPVKVGFGILDEGLAFVSKYPITNPYAGIISKEKDYNKWYKRDYFSVNINGINFYNVHIGWDCFGEDGMDQIKNLIANIKEGGLTFIGGDFNYSDDSNEIQYLKKYFYSLSDIANFDSFKNPTFHFELDNNSNSINKMIDFIFCNQQIELKDFKIVFNTDYVSDHSGIFCEI